MRPARNFTWNGKEGFADYTDIFGKLEVPHSFVIEGDILSVVFNYFGRKYDNEGDILETIYKSEDGQFTVRLAND